MNVDPINKTIPVDAVRSTDSLLRSKDETPDIKNKKNTNSSANDQSSFDTKIQSTLDKATGLIQTIVTDKITDKVIRKMPTDEYLRLLRLLDNIVSGSVDKKI